MKPSKCNSTGKWKATIRRVGYPTVTERFGLHKACQDFINDTLAAMNSNTFVNTKNAKKALLSDVLSRYQSTITVEKAESTQKTEHNRINRLIKVIGGYTLATFTKVQAEKYFKKRASEKATAGSRIGKTISFKDLEKDRAILSNLYTVANDEWDITIKNPMRKFVIKGEGRTKKAKQESKVNSNRERRLEPAELLALVEECTLRRNPMLAFCVEIAIETAMRKTEILTLEIEDVDLERRIVFLSKTKNSDSREVFLTKTAKRLFEKAIANRPKNDDTTLIFYGNAYDKETKLRKPLDFSSAWTISRDNLKIKDFHFHDLRHESLSRFAEKGMPIDMRMAQGGHKSEKMARHYSHPRHQFYIDALDSLED